MKFIGINSSLREAKNPISQHKSFTRDLLEIGLDYISENFSDAEVELIDLGKYNIANETGAYSTNENFCLMEFPSFKDDMPFLFKKILQANGIIFSSPTYWGYPSGLLKTFFERITCLDEISDDVRRRRLQGKVAGAISTAKFDGSSRVAQDILSMANYLGFIIPPHAFAFHTGKMTTSVMEDDKEYNLNYFAKRNAKIVALNVYLMAKITKGKKWGIFQEFTHPLNEDQKKGIFDYGKEQKLFKKNKFFRDLNTKKGLV